MPKPPSWNEIRTNAAAFSARWAGETHENAEAQTFWNELLAVFGVDRKRVAYFEQQAKRTTTGGRGRIDLFWPGVLAAEHKSFGKDLAEAEAQALDYLDSIEVTDFPGVILSSDFAHIRILDLGGDNEAFTFPLTDLVKEIDRLGFIAGYRKRKFSADGEAAASVKAAQLMGRLYEELSRDGYGGHDASVLLTRLLFLMFGDDTAMWEKGLFEEYIATRTTEDGTEVGGRLAMLFQVLDQDLDKRPKATDELAARFPYVNGGLFHGHISIPTFDKQMRDQLLECCAFDWGSISAAIFGSMFQAVKSKEARQELGEHYTTEENILKTIEPLLLDELRAEFARSSHSEIMLKNLRARLGEYRFLDPACGCGNFLVITYRELRQLELDILMRLRELTGNEQLSMDATLGLTVSLEQFAGIEIEEWPARIAETAMFLVDHQANLRLAEEFGRAPERLPIEINATIEIGNAIELDWNAVTPIGDRTIILGNPPFVGMSKLGADQQADNRNAFAAVEAAGLQTGRLDYVACWYAKAIGYLAGTKARCALVSTNSITQGEQARALGPVLARHGMVIDFAHRTFKWTSEAPDAAAVHVVIIGFSHGGWAKSKRLFDYPDIAGHPVELAANSINVYLADSDVVAIGKHPTPLVPVPKLTEGNRPQDGGGLIVTADEYDDVVADKVAARYLRRLVGAHDMLQGERRYCLWLTEATPHDLASSPELKRRLAIVASARMDSPTESARLKARTPAIFLAIRQPTSRWLCVPRHSSEHRRVVPMAFFPPSDIAHDSTLTLASADEYLFGILQSSMFMSWMRTVSGRIKSDFRISPDLSYNSFPFPTEVSQAGRAKVVAAATAVLDARAVHPDASLADLYGATSMPAALSKAHDKLDAAVDALYGRRKIATEADRLRLLFDQYTSLTAPLTAIPKPRRASKAPA